VCADVLLRMFCVRGEDVLCEDVLLKVFCVWRCFAEGVLCVRRGCFVCEDEDVSCVRRGPVW